MVPGWPVLLDGWVFFGYLAKALWMSSLPLLVLTHTKQKHGLASPGGRCWQPEFPGRLSGQEWEAQLLSVIPPSWTLQE